MKGKMKTFVRQKFLLLTLAFALTLGVAVPAAAASFVDVVAGEYYVEAVDWAVAQGITTGVTENTFAPGDKCTNAQIITFLWRAQGSPEPVGEATLAEYYGNAVQWAVEQNIISAGDFVADKPCTRAMTVDYIWRTAGRPETSSGLGFADITSGTDLAKAVTWAVAAGVTTGTSTATFSPEEVCSRGQIVTLLHRAFGESDKLNESKVENKADNTMINNALEAEPIVDIGKIAGTYICSRLDTRLVVAVENAKISYTLWNIEYNDMIQQSNPGAVFNHLLDYGVDFYEDFVVLTGYTETGVLFEGVYIKEGHSLPDWAKQKFANLMFD